MAKDTFIEPISPASEKTAGAEKTKTPRSWFEVLVAPLILGATLLISFILMQV